MRKGTRIALIVSATAAGTFFFATNLLMVLMPIVGFSFALTAFAVSFADYRQSKRMGAPTQRSSRMAFLAVCLALGLLAAHATFWFTFLGRARNVSKSTVTNSNLQGIGMAVKLHVDAHGAWPMSFDELVADNNATPKQFLSICDPDVLSGRPLQLDHAPFSTSFTYGRHHGPWSNDKRLMIAWEREPWSPMRLQLFTDYGRQVLFGDGRVECLDAAAFADSVRIDSAARAERTTEPTSRAASQPSVPRQ